MHSISRRSVALHALAAVVGLTDVLTTRAFAADPVKLPQKSVGYRATPNGDRKCGNCSLFQAPSSCQKVSGDISPDGYCVLYKKA